MVHGSGKISFILMANSSRLLSEIKSALLISTGGEPSNVEQAPWYILEQEAVVSLASIRGFLTGDFL